MCIHSSFNVVEAFTEVDPDITANHIRTFLFVATRGVCTQYDLQVGLDISHSAASRNVAWWAGESKIGDSAPGRFIKTEIDRDDRRYRQLRLTEFGKEFYAYLLEQAGTARKAA